MRITRFLIAAVLAEALAVVVLVFGSIFLIGDGANGAAIEADVQRNGLIIAPVAGFVFCVLAGWWAARPLHSARAAIRRGLWLGIAVAVVDDTLLLVAGAPTLITILSTLGRIAGGWCGGWLVARRHKCATQPDRQTAIPSTAE